VGPVIGIASRIGKGPTMLFSSRKQVYLVEDDLDLARSMVRFLLLHELQVKHFSDGNSFLAESESLSHACVVLDFDLPDMNGCQVIRELQRRSISWPIIMITGHAGERIGAKALELGASGHLEKPFSPALLLAAIDEGFARVGSP
jgi:two-component system response regulator FixJ